MKCTLTMPKSFVNNPVIPKHTAKIISRGMWGSVFHLSLVTDEFIFYSDYQEGDENGCTMVYNKEYKLLSNNYFATNLLLEETIKFYMGAGNVQYMSPTFRYGYIEMKNGGEFEQYDKITLEQFEKNEY